MNVEVLFTVLVSAPYIGAILSLFIAVELAVRNEEYLLYITKELYPDVAKQFSFYQHKGSNGHFVRLSPHAGMKQPNAAGPHAGYELQRKPTTGEFIPCSLIT